MLHLSNANCGCVYFTSVLIDLIYTISLRLSHKKLWNESRAHTRRMLYKRMPKHKSRPTISQLFFGWLLFIFDLVTTLMFISCCKATIKLYIELFSHYFSILFSPRFYLGPTHTHTRTDGVAHNLQHQKKRKTTGHSQFAGNHTPTYVTPKL